MVLKSTGLFSRNSKTLFPDRVRTLPLTGDRPSLLALLAKAPTWSPRILARCPTASTPVIKVFMSIVATRLINIARNSIRHTTLAFPRETWGDCPTKF